MVFRFLHFILFAFSFFFAWSFAWSSESLAFNFEDFEKSPYGESTSVIDGTFSRESLSHTSAKSLRSRYRMGAGLGFGGEMGLFGTRLELNLTPWESLFTGFGLGPSYQAFQLGWKRSFWGKQIIPFVSLSYAHWIRNDFISLEEGSGPLNQVSPSFVDRALAHEENFKKNLLNGSLGLQFFPFHVSAPSVSYFAKVSLGMDLEKIFSFAPLASFGFLYYF